MCKLRGNPRHSIASDPCYYLPIISVIYLFTLLINSEYLNNKKTINTLKNSKIQLK